MTSITAIVSFERPSPTFLVDDIPHGREIAEYLQKALRGLGYIISGYDELEWAFVFTCRLRLRSFDVHFAHVGDRPQEWAIVTSSSGFAFLFRMFGADDKEEHIQLLSSMHDILCADTTISSLRWFTKNEWDCVDAQWHSAPCFVEEQAC